MTTAIQQVISHDTAKQGHLNTLALLDNSILERLIKLSQTCIVPDDDQLVTVTFEQMVDKAHALADIYFPQWTDRSKADFGEFLVELFSLFSEKDFWYINAFANEGYLSKATLYSSVYAHALRLGYVPKTLKSAEGWLRVDFEAGDYYQYQIGELKFSINGETYSNCEVFPVPLSASYVNIQIKIAHGYYDTMQMPFNGRSVMIDQQGIDIRSVQQRIDGVYWTLVTSFAQSGNSSTHFLVIPDELGRIEIVYGKNNFGLQPPYQSTIDTKYRIGGGIIGNQVLTNTTVATVITNLGSRVILDAESVGDLYGGEDTESMEYIRNNVPPNFRTLQRIINCSDCEDILQSTPGIYQALAINFTNSFVFYVVPTSGTAATQAEIDVLAENLTPKIMDGFSISGLPTVYKAISVLALEVIVLQGYDETVITASVKDIITNWTDPLKNQLYGTGFTFADVTAEIIRSVAGVQNVINWSVTSNATDSASGVAILATEVLTKLTSGYITVTIGY